VEKTGFNRPEVEGFRELFLGKAVGEFLNRQVRDDFQFLLGRGVDDDESWFGMTFQDVKDLINSIVPLGDRSAGELAGHFGAVEAGRAGFEAVPAKSGVLDFPEFLVLMRRLLDVNFGRIQEKVIVQQDGSPRRGSPRQGPTHLAPEPRSPRSQNLPPRTSLNVRRLSPLHTKTARFPGDRRAGGRRKSSVDPTASPRRN